MRETTGGYFVESVDSNGYPVYTVVMNAVGGGSATKEATMATIKDGPGYAIIVKDAVGWIVFGTYPTEKIARAAERDEFEGRALVQTDVLRAGYWMADGECERRNNALRKQEAFNYAAHLAAHPRDGARNVTAARPVVADEDWGDGSDLPRFTLNVTAA